MVWNSQSRGSLIPYFHLLVLSVGIIVACLAVVAVDRGPTITVIPEVIIPLVLATIVGLFSLKLYWHNYDSAFVSTMVTYSWAGGLTASAVGGWWVALHYSLAMPTVGLPEQILTLISGGIGVGLIIGYSQAETSVAVTDDATTRILTQKTWTQHSGDTPILHTIVKTVAEIEERDAVDLEPIYTHIDLAVFQNLRNHEGSPWQVRFYVDCYVIVVSSTGTVASYETKTSSGDVLTLITPEDELGSSQFS
jgi:hypothetical protein